MILHNSENYYDYERKKERNEVRVVRAYIGNHLSSAGECGEGYHLKFFFVCSLEVFFIRRCCCFSTQCAISSFHHLAFVPWTKNIFAHSACPYLCEASYSLLEIGVYVNWHAICFFFTLCIIIEPLYITRCYWCSRFRVRASNCIWNYGEKK